MEPTDNHELQIWEHGDRPWSHNEDMEYIEQRLVVRDSEANRSDYTPYDGAIFVATDTRAVYDGNGSSWVAATRDYAGLDVGGNLDVGEDVIVGDRVKVGNIVEIENGLTVNTDTTTPSADIEVGGKLHVGDDITVDDRLNVGNIAEISNDAIIDGNLDVSGSKNFIHDRGDGTEVVYTAQESADPRVVHEGQATISEAGQTRIALPDHFTTVVSSNDPRLHVQVTPHECVLVGVTDRSPESIAVEIDSPGTGGGAAPSDVTIDYRVTGIRVGYEEKQITRKRRPRFGHGRGRGRGQDSGNSPTSDSDSDQ